jgi:aryl-alcohol dehydrogenase-like predicted oxidoreductase
MRTICRMESRSIGPLSVSSVGLGCNNFGRKLDQADSTSVVDAALDAGVTFFDTADVYGQGDHAFSGPGTSEEILGTALGARRSDVVIATKFGVPMSDTDPTMRGGGAAWVRGACEGSLRRLGTDYIDLFQLHFPDEASDISETLGALNDLVLEGKVRAIGCSNFSADELREAEAAGISLGSAKFSSASNEYSLLRREVEADVLPACSELGVAYLPFFPLASGLLTGKYAKGAPAPEGTRLAFWQPREHQTLDDDVLDQVDELSAVAAQSGHSILELAFSWLLASPQVASVIAGATSPDQIRANVAAGSWKLTEDEIAAVAAL